MFIEPHLGGTRPAEQTGWIEVICGCMFSGQNRRAYPQAEPRHYCQTKSRDLQTGGRQALSPQHIVSHNETAIRSTPVNFASDILLLAGDCQVVGIDEAQFFDEAIVDICNTLANSGKRVIVAGLDMDYEGKPFGPMPHLLAVAEFVTKVHAICAQTGQLASFSFRLSENNEQVMLGERDLYEARSRSAFLEGMKAKKNEPKQ